MPSTRTNCPERTEAVNKENTKRDLFKISKLPTLKSPASYNLWSQMMHSYLLTHGLWDIVDPGTDKTGSQEENMIVTSILLDKIKGMLFREIQYERDPRNIWKYVANKMHQLKTETLEKLTDRLYKMNFESVNDLLAKFKVLVTDYQAYGGNLEPKTQVQLLANQIPKQINAA